MKGLRRLILVAAATAGFALSLTGCSKTVDRASVFDADQNEVAFARTNIGESRWLNTGLEAFKKMKWTAIRTNTTFMNSR